MQGLSYVGELNANSVHRLATFSWQGWSGVEAAMEWLLAFGNEPEPAPAAFQGNATGFVSPPAYEEVKMVVAVRRDLSMGRGKVRSHNFLPT